MVRRVLSILLCGCLLAGSLPVNGLAAEEQSVETTTDNAEGGYSDTLTQFETDSEIKTAEAGEVETKEPETVVETKTAETGEDGTEEPETAVETKTAAEEDIKADEKPVTESVTAKEPQTEWIAEENAGEAAVNKEGEETATPTIKDVQEGGYYLVADIETGKTTGYTYVYWKEEGHNDYENHQSFWGSQKVMLYPVKPNTTYVLCLKSSNEDDAQVYDEKKITTTDYKFQASASVENITVDSADIKVTFTDYNGGYPSGGSSTQFIAMTEYQNVLGRVQEKENWEWFESDSETKECTVTISLSNLKAGTEYKLPVWVSECYSDEGMRKKLDDVTFKTAESGIVSKVKLETAIDETDKTKLNYTVSIDTASGTEGLADSYTATLVYKIKGAPAKDNKEVSMRLDSSNGYKYQSSLSLYAGTDYELSAVVDGVVKTAEVSTEADSVMPVITLSPLSFGGKLHIAMEGTPEASDTYNVRVNVKAKNNDWVTLRCATKEGSISSYGGVYLMAENNYQGEWLVYENSYIGAASSYEIKAEIYKNNTQIGQKYFVLDTSAISLEIGMEDVGGRAATITAKVKEPDEFFDWVSSIHEGAKVYYRVKGSDAEWKEVDDDYFGFYKDSQDSVELKKLAINTEYEVKVTSYSDDNIIYGTTSFQTTEGKAQGAFSDMKVQFSGFNIEAQGTYTPSDYAEKFEIYLVETDSAGTVLAESKFGGSSSRNIYLNDALLSKTAKVQFKAVETLEGKDAEGKPVQKEYLSEEYTRAKIPNVVFSISNAGTGVSTFHADLAYTGDMCLGDNSQTIRAKLYYTASGETTQKEASTSVYYSSRDKSKVKTLTFNKLTENTTYTGNLVIYVERSLGVNTVKVYEQEIALDNFTTKENKTYSLEAMFPDARLRELIVKQAQLSSSATEVTAAQLEKITYLSANRSDFDTVAVKDLTGIELLTELTSLNLRNNEISDTSTVDWSKLTTLEILYLTGNDLTVIPDLSQNTSLTFVSLEENVIPASEFENASAKLPEGITLSSDTQASQRIGGLQVIAEETYYQRAGKSPLLIRVKGYKTELPYTFKYMVDGTELSLPSRTYSSGGYILYNTDTGLAVGSHTLTVEMYQQDEKKDEKKNISFQMAEGGTYLEKTIYRFNAQQYPYSMNVYSDKPVSAAYMQMGGSIIAMDLEIDPYKSDYEYRYKTLSNSGISLNGLDVYRNYVGLERIKYQNTAAGTYDLRVVYDDKTEETLPGVIEIMDKALVTGGNIGYDYDSTGDYFYLSIYGYGFDASKINYAFTYEGTQQEAVCVNAKATYNGYIVKFKKADAWMPKEGNSVTVKLTPKDGYDVVFENDTFSASISQGIYYCAYNEVTNKIEVGVTSNLKRENVAFKLTRYNSWEDINKENAIETIEVNPENVTETISYLVPMKDGAVYKLPGGSYYKVDMTCGDCNDSETFDIYGGNTGYWSGSKYVGEGTGDTNFYFYSEIPFVNADGAADFQAEITGGTLTSPVNAKKIWTYSYNDALTTAGMTFDKSKLAQGNYTITLNYKNEKLSSYTFTVLPADKFVMTNDDNPYASWIDDNSFRVSFDTVNAAETDTFTVTLTDIFGNKVSGLKTEVANRYTNSVNLKVTGLAKKDAYKYYYIYVTHDKLGEAYKPDRTTKFFADEKGKYKQISDSNFTWTSDNNRMVGIGMYSSIAFPVTVNIYKPYDTEVITSVIINKGDLESNASNPAWYYFKQSLIDALPDKEKDSLYNIVASDSNGQTSTWTEPLGIRGGATSTWTVSPTQLSLSLDNDAVKTGTITVTGSKAAPTFKSENTKVATVEVDKTDKNKAVVTAVAEGTANISVTADKITKTVVVTVTKEPVKPTSISVTAPESAAAGGKVEISASVQPAGAWTQQSSITWTSSDSSVISIPTDSKGLVVEADALKAGTAVITAALDGTEFTASCTITVIKETSDDEQDEIAKEIGTLYFLEGADGSLADIKLPEGWSWEDPTQQLKADNSHPVQDFMALYNKDDVSFERYLDVHVSKLEEVRIVGKSTVKSGDKAFYIGAYTYSGADPTDGFDVSWQWTAGANLALPDNTGRRITASVLGNDTLSVKMTVTSKTTGKAVSGNAVLNITAGEIPDSEPELENKKITVYKNSTQHVPIGLVAKDGNLITDVKTDKDAFKTEKDENGEWLIWLANGSGYTKKTSETLNLTVKTESGTDYPKTLGVTVDVTEITAKNVKFKQTLNPNAAYSNAETVRAEFNVSSKYIIEDITAVKDDSGAFTVKSYNPASGMLVLEAAISKLDKDTKTYPAKAQVKVQDYGTWTLDINVAVQNKKPSLKLGDAVILSGVNADASVALYNGKTEISSGDYTVTKTDGDGVTLAKEGGMLKVAYTGTKNGSYKAKVKKNTWADGTDLELKGKVSVLDPVKAKLGADLSKVTINISEGYSAPVTISAGIKGSSVSVDLTAAPDKEKDEQAITVEVLGGGKIRITPKTGAKKGSYKAAVSGSIGGTAVKGMSIKVTLTDKAPEVKLSAKGSINLANREGTSIVYTPTLKNLPETLWIKNVRMDKTAPDSSFFNVKLTDEGKVVLTAVTGKTMNPKTKYHPVLIFTLNNGKTVKTDVKFTVSVTNKLPKVTAATLSGSLCSTNAEHRASYKLNAGNGYTISNVTTTDASYKVTFDGRSSIVYVSLAEDADVTVGKKYTVPCTIYIKGADNTTKPLTVKLKVAVY